MKSPEKIFLHAFRGSTQLSVLPLTLPLRYLCGFYLGALYVSNLLPPYSHAGL